jgi:hypothetical protein
MMDPKTVCPSSVRLLPSHSLLNFGFATIVYCHSLFLIKIFSLFPVVLALAFTWSFGAILTPSDVWDKGNACGSYANTFILEETLWSRVPYLFQWGAPIFR